jgi:hypothetical protein
MAAWASAHAIWPSAASSRAAAIPRCRRTRMAEHDTLSRRTRPRESVGSNGDSSRVMGRFSTYGFGLAALLFGASTPASKIRLDSFEPFQSGARPRKGLRDAA